MSIQQDAHSFLEKLMHNNPSKKAFVDSINEMSEEEFLHLFKGLASAKAKTDGRDADMMTVGETAELFGLTDQAVYKWIKKGKIQYINTSPIKGGRGFLIPKEQFTDNFKIKNGEKVFSDGIIDAEAPGNVDLGLDLLLLDKIIQHSFDEIFITDASGKVLQVSPSCRELYAAEPNVLIGQTVENLEEQGMFTPSVSNLVLHSKNAETRIQNTSTNKKVIVSAYPVFDDDNNLVRVVSFSRDVTEIELLKKKNEQVAQTVASYAKEIAELKKKQTLPQIDQKMQTVMELTSKVSALDVPILLEGETGAGKTRLAHFIHEKSLRHGKPFIEVNCGAIPESLIESELFGYAEGAFTGAKKGGKKGYFELAQGGTILLDEIAELPYNLQVKLLSVLQNRKLTRVGGSKEIHIDCRVVCATNKNLEQLVQERGFREDLYYRINVINITVPPLRERKNELISLIYEFTKEFNEKHHLSKSFSLETITWMTYQKWPGNVRELRNFIEKTMITSNHDLIDLRSVNQFESYLKNEITLE